MKTFLRYIKNERKGDNCRNEYKMYLNVAQVLVCSRGTEKV
jgi:hypothetical protein